MAESFKERLKSGSFQIVARLVPPKRADLSGVMAQVPSWRGKVGAVLVADNPSAAMGVCSLVLAGKVKAEGHEVIMTISCRDRNRVALGSTALGAAASAIESVLCVSGDHFNFGDHPEAKPVYDMDSAQLIAMLREMGQGRDAAGNPLGSPICFFVGAVACAAADPLFPHLMKLRKKIAAGAEFIITLPVFSVEQLDPFLEAARDLPAKILAGVLLPSYQEIARYRDGSIPGTLIPEALVTRWREDGEAAFLESSAVHVRALISALKESGRVAGVCISASGRESEIEGLL